MDIAAALGAERLREIMAELFNRSSMVVKRYAGTVDKSLRLRALLARTHGDEAGYRQFADRYRTMANDLGFEGHIAIAEAMQ
jgi:hypothetical protein